MEYLKQSTAATVKLGPFLDDTDGKTAEVALAIAQADIRLSKNGGAFAQTNNAAGATHDEKGWYGVPLNTTDTGTLGRLKVAIHESGALPCFAEFMIVTANVYDSMCSTDKLEVDVTHLLGTAWLAPGVAGTPDVNAKQLGGTAQTGRDVGADVLLSSGSGAGQLDFTSGVVKSNLAQILGTALTETAGWLAAGFKKLFNVAAPVLVASDVMRGTDSAALATGVELNAQGKLDVNAECDTALTDYDGPTKAEQDTAFTEIKGATWAAGTDTLEHIRDKETDIEADTQDIQSRIPAALVTGRMSSDAVAISGSTDAADKLEASAETIVVGAAAAGTLSTTQMTTNLTEATDDHYNGRIILWTSGVLKDQASDCTDYDGGTKMLTYTATTEAPSDADSFVIV